MATMDYITDLRDRLADDGFDLPATWTGRMEALIAGVVDHDDVADLACSCGIIADSRAVNPRGPSFAFIAETLAEPVDGPDGLHLPQPAAEVLLAIARYADGEGE